MLRHTCNSDIGSFHVETVSIVVIIQKNNRNYYRITLQHLFTCISILISNFSSSFLKVRYSEIQVKGVGRYNPNNNVWLNLKGYHTNYYRDNHKYNNNLKTRNYYYSI